MEASTAYLVRQLGYKVEDRGIVVWSLARARKLFSPKHTHWMRSTQPPVHWVSGPTFGAWGDYSPPPNTMTGCSYTSATEGLYLIGLNSINVVHSNFFNSDSVQKSGRRQMQNAPHPRPSTPSDANDSNLWHSSMDMGVTLSNCRSTSNQPSTNTTKIAFLDFEAATASAMPPWNHRMATIWQKFNTLIWLLTQTNSGPET